MFPKKIWLFKRQTNWDKGSNLIINDNSCLLGKKKIIPMWESILQIYQLL